MRTINLEVTELSSVLESRDYLNAQGESRKVKRNTIYSFSTLNIDFSCKLYIDDEDELGFIEINGEKPAQAECFYTLEDLHENELKNFYEVLMEKYNFLPSYAEHDEQLLCINPHIEYKEDKYEEVLLTEDSIYLLGLTESAEDYIVQNYSDEHFYNKIKQIKLTDIKDIDIVPYNDDILVDIYVNDSVIKIDSGNTDKNDLNKILDFKRTVKLLNLK